MFKKRFRGDGKHLILMNDFSEFIQNDLSLLPEMLRMSHEDFNTRLDVSELAPELTLWESTDSRPGESDWRFLSFTFLFKTPCSNANHLFKILFFHRGPGESRHEKL